MRQSNQNQNQNQNQNKQRMRGRGRKGPNVLSRSFESNGPDVKVRGTAMHIAEKYQQLARDAHASGDRIMAENYYQHAEHYSRMVAAAQPQPSNSQSSQDGRGASEEGRSVNEDNRDNGEDDRSSVDTDRSGRDEERASHSSASADRSASERPAPRPAVDASLVMPEDAPQPFIDNMPNTNTKRAGGNGRDTAAATPAPVVAEAEAEAGDDEDEPTKPRRRTRGTRGRGARRVAPVASDADVSDDNAHAEPVAADAAPTAEASDA